MTWNSIWLKSVVSTSIFLFLSGCSTSKPAPVMSLTHPLTQVNKPDYSQIKRGSYNGSYYEVQKGETLYFIAYITNQDVNNLIRINQLPPPHTIYPGQKLKLWDEASTGEQIQIAATTPAPKADVIITPISALSTPPSLDKSPEIEVVELAATKVTPKPEPETKPEPKSEPKSEPKPEPEAKPEPKPSVVEKPITPPSVSLAANQSQTANSSQKTVSETVKKEQAVDLDKPKGYSQKETKPKQEINKKETKQAVANKVEVKKEEPKPAKAKKVTWDWPTKGRIVAGFSNSESGNKGLDIAGSYGQDIVAAGDGRVMYAGNALRGYGNLIIIRHDDNYLSAYAHNDSLFVSEGQSIKQGQKIASMGSSGTDSVRLHFEIRYKGKSVNPLRYLPKQ